MIDITVGYTPGLSLKSSAPGSMERRARPSRPGEANGKDAELKKACQDFESIFLAYMLREMRKTIPKSDFLDGGMAEDIFKGVLDEKLAEEMSRGGGMGLADLLYEQLRVNDYQASSYNEAKRQEKGR